VPGTIRALLAGDAVDVAPLLLNKLLVHGPCSGRVIEVEAYRPDDPASHSFRGRTLRNAAMFGAPGTLYVYFTYGMHWCANVVTGAADEGAAVLLRAVRPVDGLDLMRQRRGGRGDIANGPAKLCQAMAIGPEHNATDLLGHGPVRLVDDGIAPPVAPLVGPRIGITKAADRPWRFRVPDDEMLETR
jgi:DNA-3-methyladenine glycosylase